MQVWSLSSGSCGNCYVVTEGSDAVLLEAGLGVARMKRELGRLGMSLSHVGAVVASHEHSDHWSSALMLARRSGAPLVCSAGTWQAGRGGGDGVEHARLAAGGVLAVGSLAVEAFSLPHDAREPLGFLVHSSQATVCLATDMGIPTEEVVERAAAADLVILEANHDVEMLVRGPYPAALKRRILGERGHLSNESAARVLVRIARGRPRHFWLAHLSHTNNSPRQALSTVQAVLRHEGLEGLAVGVALRDRRSVSWNSETDVGMEQLRLL